MDIDPFSILEDSFSDWTFASHSPYPVAIAAPMMQSAFTAYTTGLSPLDSLPRFRCNSNIHRRAIGLLRRINNTDRKRLEVKRSRGFRHMMKERERLSHCFANLHSMLPPTRKTKGDRYSIVQLASSYVRELKEVKEKMGRRSKELEEMITGTSEVGEVIKVEEETTNSSAIESLMGSLKCLKAMDVKATSILFQVAGEKLPGYLTIQDMFRRQYVIN